MENSTAKGDVKQNTVLITENSGVAADNSQEIASSVEKSIVRKLDFKLLPIVSLMYFFNSLDRSNLGNAKTDGLDADLHLRGNQYSIILAVFNATFCLFDLPSNLLLKKYSGKVMLPAMMLGWGSITLIQCATHDFAGLLICRLLMGCFEAGFMAGTIFYLTQFYKRNELAFRLSIFYGTVTIAGAFSGLISFGVFQVQQQHSHLRGWKYLFLIEGGCTLVVAAFAIWFLPVSGSQCHWFDETESQVAQLRLRRDGSIRTGDALSLHDALTALLDWRIAVWAIICFCYGIGQTSVSNFLPQMVALLGYSTIWTNLYTVAPYAAGTVVLWLLCWSSDYFRERSLHLAGALVLTLIGYIILIAVDVPEHRALAYFACFLLCFGAFAPTALFHSWHANNVPVESARAAVVGLMAGSANCAGIPSSFAFDDRTAPKYLPALIVNCVFLVVGIVVILGLGMWFRFDNHRRNRAQGIKLTAADVPTEGLSGGWKDSNWRWTV